MWIKRSRYSSVCILLWWAFSFPDFQWAYPVRHTACHKTKKTLQAGKHFLWILLWPFKGYRQFCSVRSCSTIFWFMLCHHMPRFSYFIPYKYNNIRQFSSLVDNEVVLACVLLYFRSVLTFQTLVRRLKFLLERSWCCAPLLICLFSVAWRNTRIVSHQSHAHKK